MSEKKEAKKNQEEYKMDTKNGRRKITNVKNTKYKIKMKNTIKSS